MRFSDGFRLQPRAVIWATGFALDHSWIDVPIFDVGLTWQFTRGSALLGWVKDDAEYIAGESRGSAERRPPWSATAR